MSSTNLGRQIVIDGRVFATEASDRGMGRYVDHIISLLTAAGHHVTLMLPEPMLPWHQAWIGAETQTVALDDDPLACTLRINRFLKATGANLYIDATPFIEPARYDVHVCPVIAILFDLIPMRYPLDYFGNFDGKPVDAYVNGIARVKKANHVIAISNYVKGHALRYLGVVEDRVSVIEPGLGPAYLSFTAASSVRPASDSGIFCIQGAHRSKNFPAAVHFLQNLSSAASCDVRILVPTPSQRVRVQGALLPNANRVSVEDSASEERKFDMQCGAGAIAHLSVDEGYGIPLAEALLLLRPVICLDTPINRELMAGCGDPRDAGILLLDDLNLDSSATVETAAKFYHSVGTENFHRFRRRIVESLVKRSLEAGLLLRMAIASSEVDFDTWHARAGLTIVAPTEIGSCGVSDYCFGLMRGESVRYVALLGRSPREWELMPALRLVPFEALGDIPGRASGALFNLAVSNSLGRGFDAIAEGSLPADVAVVHDAGSYLPGLLMQAAESGNDRLLNERYLVDESDDVRALATEWLRNPDRGVAESGDLFLEMDRRFRSNWLRAFRGMLLSHHSSFDARRGSAAGTILAQLVPQSQIRMRSRYAPMPIDTRAGPGLVRLARKMRWALGLGRDDFVACCAGSIVGGKSLDVVSRVVAGIDRAPSAKQSSGGMTLLLAGRVLDDVLFTAIREEFTSRNAANRLVQIVEGNETRYDALLLASDVTIAFREQRRIQMSHSYVRALALGRPIITNDGGGFGDADAAIVCRDGYLEADLESHLLHLWSSRVARAELAAASRSRYRDQHTIDAFFDRIRELNDAAPAI